MPLRKRLWGGHPASSKESAESNNDHSDGRSTARAPSKPSMGVRARDRCGAISIKMILATRSLPSKIKSKAARATASLRATDWGMAALPHPDINRRMSQVQSGSTMANANNSSPQQRISDTTASTLSTIAEGSGSNAQVSSPQTSPWSLREVTTCSSPPSSPLATTTPPGKGKAVFRGKQHEASQCLSISSVMIVENSPPREIADATVPPAPKLSMSRIMAVADFAPTDESMLSSIHLVSPGKITKIDLTSSDTATYLLPAGLPLGQDLAYDSEGSEHSSEFVLEPNDEACRQDGSNTRHSASIDGDDDSDEDFPPVSQEEIRQLLQQDQEMMALLTGSNIDSQEHPSAQQDPLNEQNLTELRPCYARELYRLDESRFYGDLPKVQVFPPCKKREWQEYQVGYYDPDSNDGCSSLLPFEQRMAELSADDVDLGEPTPEAMSWDEMYARLCAATR
ncbi:hypothetical protein MAPG_11946 [Magnaporthiopsis poae ATCC 64411]|uniref:Uncharacterized protein n=1 Tax=Magnaporthiopsis poae (strain ATCC 64411 / 73-15) TaxID=644358 RepID=A0A0C4EGJ3_MAGP6|nr:hypothetical protein MAPG_11946 [Magnaporthiopsis poae ATCC 64411]